MRERQLLGGHGRLDGLDEAPLAGDLVATRERLDGGARRDADHALHARRRKIKCTSGYILEKNGRVL